ncbi:YdiU family protein [Azoarcus sp. PA01]|nr:YdiU family protein [Azoarcus sp. PA01]
MKNLVFDNRFVHELPGDPNPSPDVRQVHGACFSRVMPTPVGAPHLIAWSPEVAALLGFDEADVCSPEFAAVFAGNALMPGMEPYAACYGGHQFGNWAGQLGDGRAITLGETVTTQGDGRSERWELQLKGAGPTPYSRHADGRAVLRSSIREFLCSEAMHHLGVPTTRALCLVGTGEKVVRDMFYDGRPKAEPGAVVCRVAPSFIRFGNFEIFTSRGDEALLTRLVDFTIARDFPELDGEPAARRAEWFRTVCERTARMIVQWMRVGFVHGVMNTDNMSILGLTIDYGPYGWIDNFDPNWTPNTTDAGGKRYRFGNQPHIAHWNLLQLANALYPVFGAAEPLHDGLDLYARVFDEENRCMLAAKLGFEAFGDEDAALVETLHGLLTRAEVDMTIFFRRLASLDLDAPSIEPLREAFYSPENAAAAEAEMNGWLAAYAKRAKQDRTPADRRRARMNAANPRFVLRNYLAQEAIDAAEQGDYTGISDLLDVMRHPYDEQPGRERFAARRPDWARNRAGCSMLSCSS